MVKSINIFFDGIPSYSKILEQRKRRIKTFIDSVNRKDDFDNYFKNIEDSIYYDNEIYFEYKLWISNKYSFDKPLGPYSEIMILKQFFKQIFKKIIS